MVSCLLRDRLETKLTELYANGYETFIDEQAEAPGSPENCFDELIALTSTQQNAQFYEYHQALDCLEHRETGR